MNNLDVVELELELVLGATNITLETFNSLTKGSILNLGLQSGEQSFLLVSGEPIARGDVMVLDKNMGLRISKVFDVDDILRFTRKYFGT